MIRTLALICLIAAPEIVVAYEKGFKRTWGINPFTWGKDFFVNLPQNNVSASEAGWELTTRPSGPSEYESLEMWCPNDINKCICLLTDPADGNVVGMQAALHMDYFVPMFDMNTIGFTNWTLTINGTIQNYYTINQYYTSPEYLATDPANRKVDNSSLIQENLILTGFNGKLYNVSTVFDYIKDNTTSPYTKQACMIFMGEHYYYNMTKSLVCAADTLFPWFPIYYDDLLVAVGLMVFGNSTLESSWFEAPARLAVEVIVPNGPTCLYELADKGVVTLHTYFVDPVRTILCI